MSDLFAEMTEAKEASTYAPDISPARPTEDGQPQSEPLTEDQLLQDQKFINNSKVMYSLMQGEPFTGSDREAGRYGINLIADFNYNFAQPFGGEVGGVEVRPGAVSQATRLIANGSRENAMRWVYMMDQYQRLPDWTASGSWRMARGLMMDPSTWGALFTGGAGFVARTTGQKVVSASLRQLAEGLATKKALAVGGGVYTGVPSAAEVVVKEQAGIEPTAEDIAMVAGETAIGAAAGPLLAEAVRLAPEAVRAVSDIIEPEQTLRHGTTSTTPEASLKVDKPIGGPRAMGPGVYFDTKGGSQSDIRLFSGGTTFELKVPKKVMRDRVLEYLQKVDDLPDDARARLLIVAENAGEQPTRGESVGNLIARLRANPNISDQDLIDQGFSGLKRKKQQEAVIWDQSLIDSATRSETKGRQ
jgi:hypothetical protein